MSPSFTHLMTEATRLTRAGELQAATAAIQAALSSPLRGAPVGPAASTRPDDRDVVIDVEAREIRPEEALVPDAEAKHDADPTPAPASPPPPVGDGIGQFVSGRHVGPSGSADYKLYIPPGPHGRPLPLVVMLHGCTQDPDDFAAGTAMNEQARERGFFVLYPAQAKRANASRCWNWFKHNHQGRDRGEPAMLAAMTRAVMLRHGIDPRRVYVAGLSAGGAMAAILAEGFPELYAAVGVHSGLPPGAARDLPSALNAMKSGAAAPVGRTPEPRVPIIVFHGDQDPTVHPANGERLVAPHAQGREVRTQRMRSAAGRESTRRVWLDAEGRVAAEHWTVHGAGHAWSGGSARGSYTDAQGPDATAALLDFFFAHPRPEAP